MKNSKQLFAERQRLADNQAALVAENKTDEALVVEGQIKQLDITLEHVLDEEDKLRNELKVAKNSTRLGESVLGARDEFRGLEMGYRNATSVVTVGAPTEIELALPSKSPSLFNNFISTIPSTPAQGDVHYKQRAAQTGEVGTWGGVTDGTSATKAQVIYAWNDATAVKETIAGYVPVSKDTLRDYDELMGIIENDLVLDVREATDARCLKGSNSSGIVGAINTPGILSFADAVGGLYFEAIRKMRTKVMTTARRIPTHVCLSPEIKEAIDLYKTETGLYQAISGDTLWGMQVIEDINCDGILVYDSFASRVRPVHGLTVEVGYYNDQFIKNELSILAEQTAAYQVIYPDALCYATKENLDK
jgi:hypothetical protein